VATRKQAQQRPRRPRIERERSQFKQLLIANPNYFGTAPQTGLKAVAEAAGTTRYEEIGCIGFEPEKGLLEATVLVKLPYGYGGSLCGAGTTEYLRFYVDLGAGWQDVGVAAFNAHDIPDDTDCFSDPEKPLSYVVTVPYKPQADVCDNPTLPNVRAILSWELMPPPNAPNWTPVWGNVFECNIQLDPAEKGPWWWIEFLKGKLVDAGIDLDTDIPIEVEPQIGPIPLPDPPPELAWPLVPPPKPSKPLEPMPLAELAQLYRRRRRKTGEPEIGPDRFALPHAAPLIARPGLDPEVLALKAEEWKAVKLDPAALVAAFQDTGDTTYEELECVGLEYNLERLVATIRVKLPYGYGGPLCSPGSVEYVAFWADWDDTCDWTYVGTAQVVVHDLPIPAGGLCYSVVLPVDLTQLKRECKEPRIVRIRSVLSWAVPPSTTDPNALTRWGNRLDTHVQIPPGKHVVGPQALIAILGGIPTGKINAGTGLTTPDAFFAINGIHPDSLGRPCPFGGLVSVQGPTWPGYKYRISVRKVGDPTWSPVTNSFWVVDLTGAVFTLQTADLQGFFTYVPFTQNIASVLAQWGSFGDELWEVQLELADMAHNVLDTTSHRIQLDNTGPQVDVQITGLIGNCGKFTPPATISGTFVARDLYLGSWSLGTSPQPPAPVNPSAPSPSSGTVQTPPSPGSGWSLNTTNMTPCGYTITITAVDRAIVNSAAVGHWASFAQGFCIE
jgi:hypothetical protein